MQEWSHAAHSIPVLTGSGRFSFRVPRHVQQVVLGLAGQDASQRPDEATHGLLFRGGQVRVFESGVPRGMTLPYADADFWHIVRIRETVYYCRAVDAPTTEAQARAAAFWISSAPSVGPVVLDATLFATGDEVRDAEMAGLPDADPAAPTVWRGVVAALGYRASVGPVRAGGGGRAQLAWPLAARLVQPQRLALLRAHAGERAAILGGPALARLKLTLPALRAGRRKVSEVRLYERLQVRDEALDATRPGGRDRLRLKDRAGGRWVGAMRAADGLRLRDAAAALVMLVRRDVLRLRDALRGASAVRRADALRVRDEVRAGSAALRVGDVLRVGDGAQGGTTLRWRDALRVMDGRVAQGAGQVLLRDALLVRDSLRATRSGWGASGPGLVDVLHVRDAVVAGRGGLARGRDVLLVRDSAQVLDARAVAWVMNAETGAVCWWQNWQFVDAVQLADGRVLAVGPQGVSEWVGQTDEDEPVRAHVTWGLLEMGGFDEAGAPRPNERLKRMTQLTVGYHAEQALQLMVHAFAHGQTPVNYTMPPQVAGRALWHRNHRLMTGRGMRARYWRMQLSGVGPFQVHGLTADMAMSTRRM